MIESRRKIENLIKARVTLDKLSWNRQINAVRTYREIRSNRKKKQIIKIPETNFYPESEKINTNLFITFNLFALLRVTRLSL